MFDHATAWSVRNSTEMSLAQMQAGLKSFASGIYPILC